jgi:sterol-4alpha-carboxylate 3-dehydrogenase (decarboxylating)
MSRTVTKNHSFNILVTGGAGFLGKHIVKEFLSLESPVNVGQIRVFDLQKYPDPGDLEDTRLSCVQSDIRNPVALHDACKNIDIVIHAAAIVDWGTHSEIEVYEVNVDGTKNVIHACKENKVPVLIFTSSLDSVYNGKPLIDIDENLAFPEKHSNMYCHSKYLSERMVLDANEDKLRTAVLRPADIYGEGDPYHIDSLINMAKNGFYVRLGNGSSLCQHVYVGNMAYAHVLLSMAMIKDPCVVCGETYFITDGPGANFFKFFDQIVEGAGYTIWPRNLWLPQWFAYILGSMTEFIAFILRPFKHHNPKFSRFAVTYTCTDFTFSADKAKKEFGFYLKYGEKEALRRTVEYYKGQR